MQMILRDNNICLRFFCLPLQCPDAAEIRSKPNWMGAVRHLGCAGQTQPLIMIYGWIHGKLRIQIAGRKI